MDGYLAFSQRVQNTIENVLGWLSSMAMIVITLFALFEIVRRYIFSVVFEWGQDAIVVGMVASVALFFSVTQTSRSHLVMNAIVQLLHTKGYLKTCGVLRIFVSGIVAVFTASIGITGWSSLDYAIARDLRTYSLVIPLWPFFLILMTGFLMMAFVATLQLIEDIIGLIRGDYLTAGLDGVTDV